MISSHFQIRRVGRIAMVLAAASAVALPLGMAATAGASTHSTFSFSFRMVPSSPGIKACLPHAGGSVTITRTSLNDLMTVSVHGMPHHAGFDLFVLQLPAKPFGVAWYQTDLQTDSNGNGTATVRGIFNVETFSISTGGTTTFKATHQYHLGLWFNTPSTPFNLGCEGAALAPIVTPFNGNQHAGIQVLNTANFPVGRGPLAHVPA